MRILVKHISKIFPANKTWRFRIIPVFQQHRTRSITKYLFCFPLHISNWRSSCTILQVSLFELNALVQFSRFHAPAFGDPCGVGFWTDALKISWYPAKTTESSEKMLASFATQAWIKPSICFRPSICFSIVRRTYGDLWILAIQWMQITVDENRIFTVPRTYCEILMEISHLSHTSIISVTTIITWYGPNNSIKCEQYFLEVRKSHCGFFGNAPP